MPTNLWPTPGVGDGAAEAIPAPTFLIIGAMKTGTTSLYHYLAHHPQVHMPRQKEIDFFSEPAIWRLGWEWYLGQFASAPSSAVAIGEASTSYTKFPEFSDVPRRIAERLPRVRLVYLIRHPVERIHSQYAHHVLMGDERRPISEALLADPRYLNTSQYAMQLEQYLRYFDRDQILIVQAEHLRSVRRTTVRRIFTFLGIDPEWTSPVIDQEFYQTAERWWVPPTSPPRGRGGPGGGAGRSGAPPPRGRRSPPRSPTTSSGGWKIGCEMMYAGCVSTSAKTSTAGVWRRRATVDAGCGRSRARLGGAGPCRPDGTGRPPAGGGGLPGRSGSPGRRRRGNRHQRRRAGAGRGGRTRP